MRGDFEDQDIMMTRYLMKINMINTYFVRLEIL